MMNRAGATLLERLEQRGELLLEQQDLLLKQQGLLEDQLNLMLERQTVLLQTALIIHGQLNGEEVTGELRQWLDQMDSETSKSLSELSENNKVVDLQSRRRNEDSDNGG